MQDTASKKFLIAVQKIALSKSTPSVPLQQQEDLDT